MSYSMIKYGHPITRQDRHLLMELLPAQREAVLAWIRESLIPGVEYSMKTSYGIKHLMEAENGIYVTNNQFKDAMLQCGFKPMRSGDLNWQFKIHRRSPAFTRAEARYTHKEILYPPMLPEDEENRFSFYGWMQQQRQCHACPINDLADIMYADLLWPRENSYTAILGYLEQQGATDQVIEIFKGCWRRYCDGWVGGVPNA